MVVLKFGGTSVQDQTAMNQVLDIASEYVSLSPLLVSSAMAGVTNQLIALTESIENSDEPTALKLVKDLEERHYSMAQQMLKDAVLTQTNELLELVFKDIKALVKGSFLLGDCSLRVKDALWGTGELLSTRLLNGLALQRGFQTQLLDSRNLIVTDERFGEAGVIWPETVKRVKAAVHPIPGTLLIAQGFIGATMKGVATVLGRGGSDYSASLLGAALDAKEIQIWTDVNGIMTTDPRKIKTARSIPVMTYEEAAELAFFGAKVVHPATIQPAVEKAIPVLVKNTKNPEHPGTTIQKEAPGKGLRAIAGRKGVVLITLTSSRMLMAYGFLKSVFEVFNKHKIPVDVVSTSEVSLSMTIDAEKDADIMRDELMKLGTLKVEKNIAVLSLVGQDLWKDSLFLVKVFQALKDIPPRLISQGASENNLTIAVGADKLDAAIERIHEAFFPA